ncbi:hypothetical protein NC652_023272 [Populus alba x Populus x berolinensis]|nr:hypothetical protein NC652_023272 [Populus alba x Populus x berolinensis]
MSSNDAIYIRSQSAARCLNFPITLTKHLLYDGPFFYSLEIDAWFTPQRCNTVLEKLGSKINNKQHHA